MREQHGASGSWERRGSDHSLHLGEGTPSTAIRARRGLGWIPGLWACAAATRPWVRAAPSHQVCSPLRWQLWEALRPHRTGWILELSHPRGATPKFLKGKSLLFLPQTQSPQSPRTRLAASDPFEHILKEAPFACSLVGPKRVDRDWAGGGLRKDGAGVCGVWRNSSHLAENSVLGRLEGQIGGPCAAHPEV